MDTSLSYDSIGPCDTINTVLFDAVHPVCVDSPHNVIVCKKKVNKLAYKKLGRVGTIVHCRSIKKY